MTYIIEGRSGLRPKYLLVKPLRIEKMAKTWVVSGRDA